MEEALTKGKAEGILDGPIAFGIKKATHSAKDPAMKIEQEGKTKEGCFLMRSTLTVFDVPSTSDVIIGDYVTVTRTRLCPDGKQPKEGHPVEVISCTIGGKLCAPPAKK